MHLTLSPGLQYHHYLAHRLLIWLCLLCFAAFCPLILASKPWWLPLPSAPDHLHCLLTPPAMRNDHVVIVALCSVVGKLFPAVHS